MRDEEAVYPYLSGLFDGEGYVHMTVTERKDEGRPKRQTMVTRLAVAMITPGPVYLFEEYLGGKVTEEKRKTQTNNNIVYKWAIYGEESEIAAKKLMKYCTLKHKELELYLEARATIGKKLKGHPGRTEKGKRISEEVNQRRKRIAEAVQNARAYFKGNDLPYVRVTPGMEDVYEDVTGRAVKNGMAV